MFCLANTRSRYGTLKVLIYRGIQPRTLTPLVNSVISYTSACSPCGRDIPTKTSSPSKCSPCGPTGGGGGNRYTYKPYKKQGFVDHDYKNMALKRPMTPHLEIFAMTGPATMSILQRMTGVLVTLYAVLLSGGTLFLANGIETYVSVLQSLDMGRMTAIIVKLVLGLPFAYHYCNGIRFCIWNTARLLTIKDMASTAKMTIMGALITAVIFAVLF